MAEIQNQAVALTHDALTKAIAANDEAIEEQHIRH